MIRSLLLFAHVSGMLMLFVGLGLEWCSLAFLWRATSSAEALPWLHVRAALPRGYGLAFLLILASGIYLAAQDGVYEFAWVRIAFVGMLVMGILGRATIRQEARAAESASSEQRREPGSSAQRPSSRHVFAEISLRTRIALGLAIVYLMIGKLEVRDSLLVVAIALVVGVATMLSPGLRRRRLETGQHAPLYSR